MFFVFSKKPFEATSLSARFWEMRFSSSSKHLCIHLVLSISVTTFILTNSNYLTIHVMTPDLQIKELI